MSEVEVSNFYDDDDVQIAYIVILRYNGKLKYVHAYSTIFSKTFALNRAFWKAQRLAGKYNCNITSTI